MKCPACFNPLTEIQVGSVAVDVCQNGCGGIWFDAFELERVDDEKETGGDLLVDIHRNEKVVVDTSRKRECPRCEGIKLQHHFFSAKRKVEVDQCPNCGGYWLDAGELAQIRAEKGEAAKEAASKGAISISVIRYLYRLKTQSRET